ncbi:hypothetical protein B0H14DRAFT_3498173 [Mycena olivaceomarginata]|nr:hypothetical protein B0H14DRAFT_3498173 [Mycena olivaceomarginata]
MVLTRTASGTKANRGFVNLHTARLNTPVKFPATEETYAAIRNGDIAVLGTDMPYLMYRDGYVFNPDDREDGLLEGSTLFATAKHIYQGPSTTLKPDGCARGRAGNASINGTRWVSAPLRRPKLRMDTQDIKQRDDDDRPKLGSKLVHATHSANGEDQR